MWKNNIKSFSNIQLQIILNRNIFIPVINVNKPIIFCG